MPAAAIQPSGPAYDWGDSLPVLEGRRVRLRPLRDGDAEDLLAIFGDPEVMRYWSGPPLPDVPAALGLMREIGRLFRARTLFQWGVAGKEDDRVLGTGTLFQWDLTHRRASVGYALRRSAWGRGMGRDLLETLLGFAFDTLRLHRIEADVDPRNERSLRMLARQGFRREGLLRERFFVGAEVQDSVWLGLLRSEWGPAVQPSGACSPCQGVVRS